MEGHYFVLFRTATIRRSFLVARFTSLLVALLVELVELLLRDIYEEPVEGAHARIALLFTGCTRSGQLMASIVTSTYPLKGDTIIVVASLATAAADSFVARKTRAESELAPTHRSGSLGRELLRRLLLCRIRRCAEAEKATFLID